MFPLTRPPARSSARAYRAYGLDVSSTFALPELTPLDPGAPADLTIVEGRIGDCAGESAREHPHGVRIGPGTLLLPVAGVARYLVEDGARITVEPAAGADDESIRLFLLGTCLGAALMQRGLLVLHGNAVRVGDACLVCLGPSGAGKSTLAAGFMRRGYALLADDVVAIDAEGAVLPGVPRIKLWRDTTEQFAMETTGFDRIRPGVEKFNVPASAAFALSAAPVRWLYLLEPGDGPDVHIEPVTGMAKFAPLIANTYRPALIEGMSMGPAHLEQCGRIASLARLAKVTRPKDGFRLDLLIDRLIEDAARHP